MTDALNSRETSGFDDDICIIGGAGHVGLPLGLVLARAGNRVHLYDLDRDAIDSLATGRLPFLEDGAEEILRNVWGNRLTASWDRSSVARARCLIVAVSTPVDEYLQPKLNAVPSLFASLREFLDTRQTIIIRSTVYPGTCQQVERLLNAGGRGPWKLAYCPERIAQGRAIRELGELPQLVSATSPEALADAVALFQCISPKIITLSVEEAVLAKLFSNAWRYVQFAVANQFFMISELAGVDFERVRAAMIDGYARATGLPSAGFAAGPCLVKDTMQLSAFTGGQFTLGQAAASINEGLPAFLVDRLRQKRDLRGLRVGILGMAFKGDIDDTRDSLAFKLAKLFRFHGADVRCSDEYVAHESFLPRTELIASSDVIVVGAPHAVYRGLQIPERVDLVDVWGIVGRRSVGGNVDSRTPANASHD